MPRRAAIQAAAGRRRGSDTPAGLTLTPTQPVGFIYQDSGVSSALLYDEPGGLVVTGRSNFGHANFQSVSAAGGHVLIYIDAIVWAAFGAADRYHNLLFNSSVYGAAVPKWPGPVNANTTGDLADFRVGSTLHSKLEDILELVVSENPHMCGFFADDLGSRSWFPNFNWSTWGSTNQNDYRAGAIAVAQTFRTVADRHGLMVITNGTWNSGTVAANGGGYPTMTTHGCSLFEGGTVEHHPTADAFWLAYVGSNQWGAASPITATGDKVMVVIGSADSERQQWVNAGVAYYTNQVDYASAPTPWGPFHSTGLPTSV